MRPNLSSICPPAIGDEQITVWQKASARTEEFHWILAMQIEWAKRWIRDGLQGLFRKVPTATPVSRIALTTDDWSGFTVAELLLAGVPLRSLSRWGSPKKGVSEPLIQHLWKDGLGIPTPAPIENFTIRQQAGMNKDAVKS